MLFTKLRVINYIFKKFDASLVWGLAFKLYFGLAGESVGCMLGPVHVL